MRAIIGIGIGCVGLGLATAQTLWDDFRGGFEMGTRWSWHVSGNSPANTLDTTHITFDGEYLQITAQPGTLYAGYNNIRNLPNLGIPALCGEWRIETRLQLNRGAIRDSYVQAGLILFRNADNYFNLHLVYDPTQNLRLRVSAGHEVGGRYEWAGLDTSPWDAASSNSVRLLIRYDPATNRVHFLYDREDGGFWRPLIGSPRALSEFPSLQAVVQQGGSIGLYIDTGGGWAIPPPVAQFDYLEIFSAPLLADINMDGIVDDADLLLVLFDFGATGACMAADLNRDGIVDDADLLQVLFHFGSGC
jgi:hypothetical protein